MSYLFNENFDDDKIMWDLWLSRYHLAAVAASDKLDLFQKIHNGACTTQLLSEKLFLDLKGIEAITCLLASLGLLAKNYEKLTLTPVASYYLLPTSSLYWGAAFNRIYESLEYNRIFDTFKKSQGAKLSANGKNLTSIWKEGDVDPETAKQFTKIMHCTIFPSAIKAIQNNIFSEIKCLLDVGGGSGCFANEFVKHHPKANAIIFELPAVCEAAKTHLAKLKASKSIKLHPGNFFKDPFPRANGILFSNIFHDWHPDQDLFLAKKAHDALPIGGSIFIHEMLLNKEKNGPLTPATFNLLMYINHGSQQFTENELSLLLKNAGFSNPHKVDTHSYYSIISAKKLK